MRVDGWVGSLGGGGAKETVVEKEESEWSVSKFRENEKLEWPRGRLRGKRIREVGR